VTIEPPTDAELAELARLLADQEVRATTQLAALTRTYHELVDAADLEPPDDEHDPDGTTAYERAQVASLLDETRATVAAVAAAQERLAAGAYGSCERCGEPVGVDRLTALPAATRCIACAAR
jgi:DnaK suppressor protein